MGNVTCLWYLHVYSHGAYGFTCFQYRRYKSCMDSRWQATSDPRGKKCSQELPVRLRCLGTIPRTQRRSLDPALHSFLLRNHLTGNSHWQAYQLSFDSIGTFWRHVEAAHSLPAARMHLSHVHILFCKQIWPSKSYRKTSLRKALCHLRLVWQNDQDPTRTVNSQTFCSCFGRTWMPSVSESV